MYGPLSRAQMRDQARRMLDQIPPVDDGGAEGAQPTRFPYPTNTELNTAINEAVAFFSRECRIGGDPVPRSMPLPQCTNLGPFALALQQIAPGGSVNEARGVKWATNTTTANPLRPRNREEMDRLLIGWESQVPGTPSDYWVEGGSLMIWPAPSCAGLLVLQFGTALWLQATNLDLEVLDVIPNDYLPVVMAQVVLNVAAKQPGDVEMVGRAKYYAGVVGDENRGGLSQMMAFFARRNRSYQSGITPMTGRIGGYRGGNR